MIVLDTNVLSVLLRSTPGPGVTAWSAKRPIVTLFTTTVTQAEIAAARRRAARSISQVDAQIAAVVMACGGELATRNVIDFAGTGVNVVHPWSA